MSIFSKSPSQRLAKLEGELAKAIASRNESQAALEALSSSEDGDELALVRAGKQSLAEADATVANLQERVSQVRTVVDAEAKARADEKAAEELAALRLKRIALAKVLDEKLLGLRDALADYVACPGPARAVRSYLQGAVGLHVPQLLLALAIPNVHKMFRVSLEQYESTRADVMDPKKVGLVPMLAPEEVES